MRRLPIFGFLLLAVILVAGCESGPVESEKSGEPPPDQTTEADGSFSSDLEFLRSHQEVLLLSNPVEQTHVVVVPAWQGRVMTSTNGGFEGPSFGWVNYDLIASEQFQPHINVFGGEDRFWLGPEGGQFAIFFKSGDPFDLEHWQTPLLIDTEPFVLTGQRQDEQGNRYQVAFERQGHLENYSGSSFDIRIERRIELLSKNRVAEDCGVDLPDSVAVVGFESWNQLTNAGQNRWTEQRGTLSIWILGMFVPSPETTVMIPYAGSSDDGGVVNDRYFGEVPKDRLVVADKTVFFKADGKYRSKIGLGPERAKQFLGSWDASRNVLTIIQYNKPADARRYVNSMWEIQKEPFAGDVVNSYNDGPVEPGAEPLGPFYELETSSPAAFLAPGEKIVHVHRTYHFTGPRADLDLLSESILGVSLDAIPF